MARNYRGRAEKEGKKSIPLHRFVSDFQIVEARRTTVRKGLESLDSFNRMHPLMQNEVIREASKVPEIRKLLTNPDAVALDPKFADSLVEIMAERVKKRKEANEYL